LTYFTGKHKSKKGDDSKGSAKKPKVKKSKTKQTKELVEENDADDEGNKAAADSDKEIKKSDDAETPKVRLLDTRIFIIVSITVDHTVAAFVFVCILCHYLQFECAEII